MRYYTCIKCEDWERLAAEMWVGCRHTNRVISLLARNEWWGSGEDIFNHAP